MKFRAYFEIAGRPDIEETPVYLEAENRDKAKEKISNALTEKFGCTDDDIQLFNLVSEFENPEGVRDRVCGWEAGKPIAWDKNPLIID